MDYSGLQIIGIILAALMLAFYYRQSIKNILSTPKESFMLMIPILFLGLLFYFFFKSKGF